VMTALDKPAPPTASPTGRRGGRRLLTKQTSTSANTPSLTTNAATNPPSDRAPCSSAAGIDRMLFKRHALLGDAMQTCVEVSHAAQDAKRKCSYEAGTVMPLCPSTHVLKSRASNILCAGAQCDENDINTCCNERAFSAASEYRLVTLKSELGEGITAQLCTSLHATEEAASEACAKTSSGLLESYNSGDCTGNYVESGPVDVPCDGCDYAWVYTCTCNTAKEADTFMDDCDTVEKDDDTYGVHVKYRYEAKHPSGDTVALNDAWSAYIESRQDA